jgi:hypothetical protein
MCVGVNVRAAVESIDAGALHLSGQVQIQNAKQMDGAVRVDVADTGLGWSQAAGWFGSSVPQNIQISGPATIDAVLSGTMEQPQITASLAANSLRLNDLKDLRLLADAVYTTDQIELPRISLNWESESASGSGHIGLQTTPPTLAGQFDVSRVSLHRILNIAGNPGIPADGNVEISATVSGTTENVVVNAKLAASDLQSVWRRCLVRLQLKPIFRIRPYSSIVSFSISPEVVIFRHPVVMRSRRVHSLPT